MANKLVSIYNIFLFCNNSSYSKYAKAFLLLNKLILNSGNSQFVKLRYCSTNFNILSFKLMLSIQIISLEVNKIENF